jgi:hypothetical protein
VQIFLFLCEVFLFFIVFAFFIIKIQHNSTTILHLIWFAREGVLQQNPIKPTFVLN